VRPAQHSPASAGNLQHLAIVRGIEWIHHPHIVVATVTPRGRVGELLPILYGMPVYFSEGLTKMSNELKSIRPTFLLAPPRVWEKIFSSITTEIKKRPLVVRKMFYGALGLGLKAAQLRHEGKAIPGWMKSGLRLADRIVFQKIRERLGGRLRIAISGSAPLGRELAQFFEAIGLPLVEGYGLTEGGVVTLNPIENSRSGSIGKVLPGVEVKLAEDGELLLRATTLFSGYYKDPAATSAVLRDGWLHTGDIAALDKDGYISITGRKKELIVASNGKKIYPSRIEGFFNLRPPHRHPRRRARFGHPRAPFASPTPHPPLPRQGEHSAPFAQCKDPPKSNSN